MDKKFRESKLYLYESAIRESFRNNKDEIVRVYIFLIRVILNTLSTDSRLIDFLSPTIFLVIWA